MEILDNYDLQALIEFFQSNWEQEVMMYVYVDFVPCVSNTIHKWHIMHQCTSSHKWRSQTGSPWVLHVANVLLYRVTKKQLLFDQGQNARQ